VRQRFGRQVIGKNEPAATKPRANLLVFPGAARQPKVELSLVRVQKEGCSIANGRLDDLLPWPYVA
jgi:hypothetical protein